MPSFIWNAARLKRLASAVRAYNAAITRKQNYYRSIGAPNLSRFLPQRVTTSSVMARITNVNDFRRIVGYANDAKRGRSSELTRILKSVNPNALDLVRTDRGAITTKYAKREKELNKRAVKRQALATKKNVETEFYNGDEFVDLVNISDPEYATLVNGTDLAQDEGEPDDSVEDIDAQTKEEWEQEDARNKRAQVTPTAMYEVYRGVWTDPINMHSEMPGYQALIDALDWLAENKTDVLNKMFALGRDELDPDYITVSGGEKNPYVMTPYDVRHMRAVDYIVGKARSVGYAG